MFPRCQTYAVLLSKEGGVAKRVELLLRLSHERIETGLHVRQLFANVVHQDL